MQLKTESGLVLDNPSNGEIAGTLHNEEFAILWDGLDSLTYLQFAKKNGLRGASC